MDQPDQDDAKLAAKIVDAVKAYDAADAVKKERAIIAGKLLAEAQKRHPTDKAFEKFLQMAGGIGIRRAKDLIAFALGRKDFEQHQDENAAAQQRHRDKLKAEKIEREKEKAALPKPEPKPEPNPKGKGKPEPEPDPALRNAGDLNAGDLRALTAALREQRLASAAALREFEAACESYLPKLNEADLKKAGVYFNDGAWKPKTNKEEAA